MILVNGGILPSGGVASGRVCACLFVFVPFPQFKYFRIFIRIFFDDQHFRIFVRIFLKVKLDLMAIESMKFHSRDE